MALCTMLRNFKLCSLHIEYL